MTRHREEIIFPYPVTLSVDPVTTHCRGTLLIASMQALKQRGHYERYLRAVPPQHVTTIVTAVASTWLPLEVGIAHYQACDSLGLPIDEMLTLGGNVVTELQRTFMGGVLKAASSGAGVTPLTGLQKFAALYGRSMKGGGGQLMRLGPKDVRMEFAGQPLSAIRYFRVAYRGFIQAGCEFFARRVVVAELAAFLSPTTVAYRIAWV